MSRLLKLGADPAKLYEQYRLREEARLEEQESVREQAERNLLARASEPDGEFMNITGYREAREAAPWLIAEPGLDPGDMTHSDYRALRMAQRDRKKPLTFAEFGTSLQ